MNVTNIYRNLIRLTLTAFLPIMLLSCDSIKDNDMDACGIYLEFIYDCNMEYSDSFDPQVNVVDVFVFDEQGKYLFTKKSRREELIGGKRMFLSTELVFGKYSILTVGGLSDSFRITDSNDSPLIEGETLMDDVRISLNHRSEMISNEFPSLWVGKAIDVTYKADLSTYPVHLIKDTNRFDLLLAKESDEQSTRAEVPPHTFEITTNEGASYKYDNTPQLKDLLTYCPYSLFPEEEPEELSHERLNTTRLIYGDKYNYTLIVRDKQTGKPLWNYDLMKLLKKIKPDTRPDGSELPMQEFLDRQSEWHVIVLYKSDGGTGNIPEAFTAVAIKINGWIIWLNEIGV